MIPADRQDSIHREPGAVTLLLRRIRAKRDAVAESSLLELTYGELRKLAHHQLRNERANHTLQPTALVNEAFEQIIKLIDNTELSSREHFWALSTRVMRRILIDYARKRGSEKRSGNREPIDVSSLYSTSWQIEAENFLLLDQALERLAGIDKRQARVVELRFFAGLTEREIADVLNISTRTVKRDWLMARARLRANLDGGASDPSNPNDLLGTTILERYVIGKMLGSGTASAAYLAQDDKNKTNVVIKLFHKGSALHRRISSGQVDQEFTALRRLSHANIVRVIEAGETPFGQPYLIREYVPGVSLREVMRVRRPQNALLTIIEQLCLGVAAAHKENVIHLDLKPENIILGQTNRVVIIDFGSSLLDNYRGSHFAAGSPNYMAPELLQNRPSKKSDLFAIGLIAFELAIGKLPSEQDRAEEAYNTLARVFSPRIASAISRAMEFNETDRFESVDAFQEALGF